MQIPVIRKEIYIKKKGVKSVLSVSFQVLQCGACLGLHVGVSVPISRLHPRQPTSDARLRGWFVRWNYSVGLCSYSSFVSALEGTDLLDT